MITPIEKDLTIAQQALQMVMSDAGLHALTLRVQASDKTVPRKLRRVVNATLTDVLHGVHHEVRHKPTAAEYATYRMKLCDQMAHDLTRIVAQLQSTCDLCAALAADDAPPAPAEN